MSADIHQSPAQKAALAALLQAEARETEAMNATKTEADAWMSYNEGRQLDVHTAALARKLDAWADARDARAAALRTYKHAMGRT